jgi:hypothetical protein
MFDNVGSKLQIMAFVFFIIGTIASVILGIITWISGSFWYGLLIIVIGILSSWLSNLAIFGIGVSAENSEQSVHLLKEIRDNQIKAARSNEAYAAKGEAKNPIIIESGRWECSKCHAKNGANENFCHNCMASRPQPTTQPEKTNQELYKKMQSTALKSEEGSWWCSCGAKNSKDAKECTTCYKKKP